MLQKTVANDQICDILIKFYKGGLNWASQVWDLWIRSCKRGFLNGQVVKKLIRSCKKKSFVNDQILDD